MLLLQLLYVTFIVLNGDDTIIFCSYIKLLLVAETEISFEDVLTHIRGSSLESSPPTSTPPSTKGFTDVLHKMMEELLTLCEGKPQKDASAITSQCQ